jgi:hypothetical protein
MFTGKTTTLHSGPTHSVGFVILVGGVMWLALRHHPARMALAVALTLAVASHVGMDYFTGPVVGLNPSFGVPALWPFADERLNAAISLFRGVKHGNVAMWFNAHNLTTAAIESLLGLPLILWSLQVLRRTTIPNPRHRGADVA